MSEPVNNAVIQVLRALVLEGEHLVEVLPGYEAHYLPKQMGENQLDDLELNGPITLRILDGIAWDFTQAK